jgi:hypothetical protein
MNIINHIIDSSFSETFNEAKEVIDYFLGDDFQTNDKFAANITGKAGWIFRGQANFNWPLLPSAFRSGIGWPKFTPQPPRDIQEAQRNIESARHWLL